MNTIDIFTLIGEIGHVPALADVQCAYEFYVNDGCWSVSVQRGEVRVSPGPSAAPDCTLDCNDRDFIAFVNGQHALTLIMQGRIRLNGSLEGLLRLRALFSQALRYAPQAIQEAR